MGKQAQKDERDTLEKILLLTENTGEVASLVNRRLSAIDAATKDAGKDSTNAFRLYPFGHNLCYETLVAKAERNADYLRDHFASSAEEKPAAALVMTHHIPF